MKGENKALQNMQNSINTAFDAIQKNDTANKKKAKKAEKLQDKKQGYSGKMPALLWQQFTEINAKSGTPNAVKINQLVAEYVANHE